ncbi:MAG: LutC/YkgG family protein [Aggregatilineales bacterium]
MDSRQKILGKLRATQRPFEDVETPAQHYHMTPKTSKSDDELLTQFADEAQKLGCYIYPVSDENEALEQLMELIGDDNSILKWDDEHIPLQQLPEWLKNGDIKQANSQDASVRIGVTGVDAALAATGSLILHSGYGKARGASLLPPVHVAVLQKQQIVADLETWFAIQRDDNLENFRQTANITVISGPSKTADIAQELVKGAHGPKEVHMIILDMPDTDETR